MFLNKKSYLDFFRGVVLALLAGLDGWGLVGAGIDEGACLDDDEEELTVIGGEELIVSGGDEMTLITSGLFTASSSSDD